MSKVGNIGQQLGEGRVKKNLNSRGYKIHIAIATELQGHTKF